MNVHGRVATEGLRLFVHGHHPCESLREGLEIVIGLRLILGVLHLQQRAVVVVKKDIWLVYVVYGEIELLCIQLRTHLVSAPV